MCAQSRFEIGTGVRRFELSPLSDAAPVDDAAA
jgi:hypothetical protein